MPKKNLMFEAELFQIEIQKNNSTEQCLFIGVDEVGRGPLCGPVVACSLGMKIKTTARFKFDEACAYIEQWFASRGIDDSKKLKASARIKICEELGISPQQKCGQFLIHPNIEIFFEVTEVDAVKIDEINILNAALQAMEESLFQLHLKCHEMQAYVLIDGNRMIKKSHPQLFIKTVIRGDSKSKIIGLASIIAKEYRDHLMQQYALSFPQYKFEKNAGYGTRDHLQAIIEHGVTNWHRKTFKGVKEYVAGP